MLQLYFIRHAQSTNNVIEFQDDNDDYLFERVVDPELTKIGLQQAQLVGKSISQPFKALNFDPQNRFGFGLTHLYSSLMVRAIRTGLAISEQAGLPLVALPEVHETGGLFDAKLVDDEVVLIGQPGPGKSYFQSEFPKLIIPEDLPEKGWYDQEKEPRENYILRAKTVIDFLLDQHSGTNDRVGVVMHGGIFKYMISVLFGLKSEHYWINMNNCAISRVDISDTGHLTLMYINKTDHLPDNLIT